MYTYLYFCTMIYILHLLFIIHITCIQLVPMLRNCDSYHFSNITELLSKM